MTENKISFQIRRAAFEIHKNLGPGLLESVYEKTLMYELDLYGINVINQVPIPINFNSPFLKKNQYS
jgi:GxxExxY protein